MIINRLILTKSYDFIILVLTELLERIEIVCDVPGDDVDAELVPEDWMRTDLPSIS